LLAMIYRTQKGMDLKIFNKLWGSLIINLILTLILISKPQAQTPSDTLKLDDVVNEVLAHNDKLAAARYMEKAAQAKVGPAGAWDDPMLMAGVINVPTNFDFRSDEMTMEMIGISQNIPYAGQKGLSAKAAREEALSAGEDTKGMSVDLAAAARNAYFDLYFRRLTLIMMQSQRELMQDIVSSVTSRLRTDQANQSDVAAAQADLWRLESDIISSEQEEEAAENDLLTLMGREPRVSLPPLAEPPLISAPLNADEWIIKAKTSYPPLVKMRHQAESYEFSARAARRMEWPMVGVSASYGIRQQAPPSTDPMTPTPMKRDNMISFQVNLSLPIFSGHQQSKMARSMDYMKQGTTLETSQMEREIESTLRTLYRKIQRLNQSLSLYQDRIVPADEDAYRSAFAGYESNSIPLSNLLTFALNIYRDRITQNQVEYQLAQTMAEVEKYITIPENQTAR
jgi:outer membrane protein, heavy metal efflux system